MNIQSIFNTFILLAGMYLVAASLIMQTKNFASSLVFKIIPFFLGMGTIIAYLMLMGFIIKQ